MSSAYYPQGMKSYNNYVNPGNYVPWKGTGSGSNPVGVTAANIRPLTNNDPGNIFFGAARRARPIKHYRKGRVIPTHYLLESQVFPQGTQFDLQEPRANIQLTPQTETQCINYNLNRNVRSSTSASLGGGAGGTSLVSQMIGQPGSFSVKPNSPDEIDGKVQLNEDCKTCQGFGIVSSFYPNKKFLTDNPEPVTEQPRFCCNEERKAKRRVIYASTNLKKNYYTTLEQYRENRCQTYEQRAFNFVRNAATL
jgi:hypothetical protein